MKRCSNCRFCPPINHIKGKCKYCYDYANHKFKYPTFGFEVSQRDAKRAWLTAPIIALVFILLNWLIYIAVG